jgi:hypothetical protein
MNLHFIKDSYDRKARLYPAMLLVLPIAVTVGVISSIKFSTMESSVAAIASCGGAFLLTQLARDNGKRREQRLFESWGGTPSVTLLRHSDSRLDPITKKRYHERLSTLVKDRKAPSASEEADNTAAADQIYNAWSTYLRTKTRDTERYPLLFRENINYGYRRNVWGLRSLGLLTSSGSLLVSVLWGYIIYRKTGVFRDEFVFAGLFAFALIVMWMFLVSERWVRLAADAYAERLAETIESLSE